MVDTIRTKRTRFYRELQHDYDECERCHLCKTRNRIVFGRGNICGKVLLIGEAPGFNEDQQGKPFVGDSGKLLEDFLAAIRWSTHPLEGNVFITNCVSCRPVDEDGNNAAPSRESIVACRMRLQRTINIIRPRIIVLVGGTAKAHVVAKKLILPSVTHGIFWIGATHPAAWLYRGLSPKVKQQAIDEWRFLASQAVQHLNNPKPGKIKLPL